MKRPELLSPAGSLDKLKIALAYGADAVYASVGSFSLRQRGSREFTKESFAEGVEYTHKMGKKIYATLNGFPTNSQMQNVKTHIEFLSDIGVDAIIIATPGVIELAKEIRPKMQIHLSTQANVMNEFDARVYQRLGVSRIVVAREMSLKDAINIKKALPDLELEIFVHGSMCFAYSGRCLISAVQSGRFSNRGSCANDCRFKYEMYAKNPENGTLFRLEESEGEGTMIMNAKDLNLCSHIEKIIQTGAIDSFKIEGRTKSEYYAASATKAYRMAIDDAMDGNFRPEIYEAEIRTLKNRGFSEGYLVHKPYERADTQNFDSNLEDGTHEVHAISKDGDFISVKGKIYPNKIYEILSPSNDISEANNEIGRIFKSDGKFYMEFYRLLGETDKEFSEIHSGNLNKIKLPANIGEFSFLRKEME